MSTEDCNYSPSGANWTITAAADNDSLFFTDLLKGK